MRKTIRVVVVDLRSLCTSRDSGDLLHEWSTDILKGLVPTLKN